jgi:penicillin-binding protein 1A
MQGASTITQQVAKNMLLTSDRTLTRKVKEAFLAQRIEKAFSKERILELYLNEIYLGARSYGVAAAALNYFNKPLDQLTIAEAAYLGALPKGPENYNPSKHKERAIARRDWVVDRMAENKFITAEEAAAAKKQDLVTVNRLSGDKFVASAHYVEELRRQLLKMYKEDGLYKGGLSVRSTLDTHLQIAAAAALRQGLDAYDRRHGWRGPLKRVDPGKDAMAALKDVPAPPGASGWFKAVVTGASAKAVNVTLEDGREGQLANEDIQWAARGAKKNQLSAGSIVYVQPLKNSKTKYGLRQVPAVEGAIVAMDPHTGRVLAMVGGYSFRNSQFNRVTQAMRQPGSSFKPIVYAAALDNGLTPSTLIEDAPFQIEAGDGTIYNPENYSKEFYGPSTLRTGIEKSRNAMTVRLAYEMGMQPIVDYAKKLGVSDNLMPVLSMSLGAGETTLMRMTGAYATFVNGGKKVTPTLIDRVQDRTGKTTFKMDQRACQGCNEAWSGQAPPSIADTREQILDPITSYQITSMLEGVVLRGTGTAIQAVGKPLAGKTGTTNDYKDAWFVGFSPDLVVGVWMGFDKPKNMGEGETGGSMAAPVFRDFMKVALADAESNTFRAPPNVRFVRIDAKTGYLPTPESTDVILEAYKPGTEPVRDVDTSTFVYGGGEAIDPRQLQGLEAPVQEGVIAQSATPPATNMGTVDDGEGGLF